MQFYPKIIGSISQNRKGSRNQRNEDMFCATNSEKTNLLKKDKTINVIQASEIFSETFLNSKKIKTKKLKPMQLRVLENLFDEKKIIR